MSKSLGNYIGIDETPNEMFGKIMSIPDNIMYSYFELLTDLTSDRLNDIKTQLRDESINPMELKKELGQMIVGMYHSSAAAGKAQLEFERVFSKKELPDEVPEFDVSRWPEKVWVVKLLTESGMASSNGEARRLIQGGGVSIDGERVGDTDLDLKPKDGMLLKVGKRRFLRLKVKLSGSEPN
jgi:tyrosyl-tRNA synthetase